MVGQVPEGRGRQRVGVLGGTFDPPHIGHLATAVNVRHALGLDRLLLTVAHRPWQKEGSRPISPSVHRLAMVTAAVVGLDGVEASDLEIRRGGPTYTADTLTELAAADPDADLFVVVGADAAAGLSTWERVDEVRRGATLVVVDRPGWPVPAPGAGWRVERVSVPDLEVSSSDLRARVADGRPLAVLVPDGVISYIHRHGLYRGGSI